MSQAISPVILITGAGRGIGRATALHLAASGARLGLLARGASELQRTLAAVTGAGAQGVAVTADVTDEEAVARAHEQIEESLGPVDVLVNNAGVGGPIGPMWEVDPGQWWRTVEINLRGTYVCSRAVLPSMVERGVGRIVNVASHAGVHRWPYFTAYATGKSAVIKLTESLAAETREHGIAVLAVHPGLVDTGIGDASLGNGPPTPPSGELAERVSSWFERQRAEGHTVPVERAAALIVDVASGRADALSGRYIAIEDDLDALIERAEEVRRDNLQALKLERLGPDRDRP